MTTRRQTNTLNMLIQQDSRAYIAAQLVGVVAGLLTLKLIPESHVNRCQTLIDSWEKSFHPPGNNSELVAERLGRKQAIHIATAEGLKEVPK